MIMIFSILAVLRFIPELQDLKSFLRLESQYDLYFLHKSYVYIYISTAKI